MIPPAIEKQFVQTSYDNIAYPEASTREKPPALFAHVLPTPEHPDKSGTPDQAWSAESPISWGALSPVVGCHEHDGCSKNTQTSLGLRNPQLVGDVFVCGGLPRPGKKLFDEMPGARRFEGCSFSARN
jgi:hypothetical protein